MSFSVGTLGAFLDPVQELQNGYLRHSVNPTAYYQRTRPLPTENPTARSNPIRHVPADPAADGLNTDGGGAVSGMREGDSEGSGKKRKRKGNHRCPNEAEQNAIRRHEELRPFIVAAHSAFLPIFLAAKEKEAKAPNLAEISPLSGEQPAQCTQSGRGSENSAEMPDSTHVIMTASATPDMSTWQPDSGDVADDVLLPMGATWQSQLCRITIPQAGGGYDVILMDPPWENRSVKRNGSYPTLPNRHLLGLSLDRLCGPGGALVGVWVTNREKVRRFVEEELLPAWHVQLAATWIWVKVSPSGSMLSPLDYPHHRPYELLLLGYTTNHGMPRGKEGGLDNEARKERGVGGVAENEGDDVGDADRFSAFPPHGFCVIGPPGEHSRKPPLHRILLPTAN